MIIQFVWVKLIDKPSSSPTIIMFHSSTYTLSKLIRRVWEQLVTFYHIFGTNGSINKLCPTYTKESSTSKHSSVWTWVRGETAHFTVPKPYMLIMKIQFKAQELSLVKVTLYLFISLSGNERERERESPEGNENSRTVSELFSAQNKRPTLALSYPYLS